MVYRKGELSPTGIDRGWPYQVALPASVSLGGGYKVVQDFCNEFFKGRGRIEHRGLIFPE
jgi:hypothetical protein